MDLLATIRKEGSRGGRANFKWEDVKDDHHRENYLGHSLMAPVGRWQKNRDLSWYAKADTADQSEEQKQRAEEIRRIKEAEQDALSAALGFSVERRVAPAVSAKEVQKAIDETAGAAPVDQDGVDGVGRGVGFGGFRGNASAGGALADTEESGLKPFISGETGPIDTTRAKIDSGKRGQIEHIRDSRRSSDHNRRRQHYRHDPDRERSHRRRRSREETTRRRRRDSSGSPSLEADESRHHHHHRRRRHHDHDEWDLDQRRYRQRTRSRSRSPGDRARRRGRRDVLPSRSPSSESAHQRRRDFGRWESPARSGRSYHRDDDRRYSNRDRRHDDEDDYRRRSHYALHDRDRDRGDREDHRRPDSYRRRSRSRH